MFRSDFFRRLFLPYLLLICLAITAVGLFAGAHLRSTYLQQRRQAISDNLSLAAELLRAQSASGPSGALSRQVKTIGDAIDCRVTVIAPDGVVLADNWANPATMDNHRARPEVIEALDRGLGESIRHSDTLRADMLYLARRIESPSGLLRLAVRLDDFNAHLRALYTALTAVAAASMLAAALLGFFFVRRRTLPVVELKELADSISSGDLRTRPSSHATGELAHVSSTLNTMSKSMRELITRAEGGRAELLTILASMSEGVIATNADQQILLANDAAARLLGFDRDEARGRPLWQVVRIDRIIKAAQEVLATGDKRAFELGMIGGRHLEISLGPYPAHADEMRSAPVHEAQETAGGNGVAAPAAPPATATAAEGLVLVIHDTTQSVRYQELRREFVANVSHELRTPLTVIKGFVETLRDGAMEDPQRGPQYLATIERHTNQLTNLVNDLLELSRLESQSDVPRSVSVDLAATARRAAETLIPAAQKKNQTLAIETPRVPLIAGNPDYLERAISNLIDNAIKYTPEGGRIAVATRSSPGEVIVEITDNGIGIPAEDIPRIFERFYRVDRSRSREMGGTGLGLSIVKHIAQTHGGRVEVTSTPGQGSTFHLHLPLPGTADE